MRHAKIVCTLGPATTGYARVKQLIEAGMDVARLKSASTATGLPTSPAARRTSANA